MTTNPDQRITTLSPTNHDHDITTLSSTDLARVTGGGKPPPRPIQRKPREKKSPKLIPLEGAVNYHEIQNNRGGGMRINPEADLDTSAVTDLREK